MAKVKFQALSDRVIVLRDKYEAKFGIVITQTQSTYHCTGTVKSVGKLVTEVKAGDSVGYFGFDLITADLEIDGVKYDVIKEENLSVKL